MKSKAFESAKKQAADFRYKYGLASDEPVMLHSLLIKLGIVTLFRPLSDDFSGMAIKSGDNKYLLINSNQSVGRQNFSIAHELYHLYVQNNFMPKMSKAGAFNKNDPDEYAADLFAVVLLMPEEGIYRMLSEKENESREIGLISLFKISGYFQVSIDATLNRLEELNKISAKHKLDLKQKTKNNVKRLAKEFGGDCSLYEPGKESMMLADYVPLANQLVENEIISQVSHLKALAAVELDPHSLSDEC